MRSTPPSSLARHVRSGPTSEVDMEAMRRAVWRAQGVATVVVGDVVDPWLRQALVNLMEARYGKRPGP